MSKQFDQVSVIKQANVYFDGKCISHTVLFPDGTKKTLGVIFPSVLTFNTAAAEIMELNAGTCRIKLKGEAEWATYEGGQRFTVPANSSFEIETIELLDYVCHFV
ncbi:MAG: pyrimidine/purine nucleoside phosphorylase [Herminiimonas sp.]|nr:pyrimidine/purine nucleoside phosphorylase [Herminiimonas sp.]